MHSRPMLACYIARSGRKRKLYKSDVLRGAPLRHATLQASTHLTLLRWKPTDGHQEIRSLVAKLHSEQLLGKPTLTHPHITPRAPQPHLAIPPLKPRSSRISAPGSYHDHKLSQQPSVTSGSRIRGEAERLLGGAVRVHGCEPFLACAFRGFSQLALIRAHCRQPFRAGSRAAQ